VSGVSGNNQRGFTTEDAAQAHYSANRHLRKVRRTCRQDDVDFGALSEACDVNWRGY
jgi:hypothetical protein